EAVEVEPRDIAFLRLAGREADRFEATVHAADQDLAVAAHVVERQLAGYLHDLANPAARRDPEQGARAVGRFRRGKPDLVAAARPRQALHAAPTVGQRLGRLLAI